MKDKQATRWPHIKHFSLIVGGLLVAGILVAAWLSCLKLPYVDKTFSYNADLQTVVRPYNPATARYEGQRYANTTYSLRATPGVQGSATVKAELHSIQLDGGQSTTTVSSYIVTAANGTVVNTEGGTPAYLFAPRGIAQGTNFSYWYAPYQAALPMHFDGVETIFGLRTYRYVSNATAGIPAIISDSAMQIKPNVHLWIEPTSGWLIKSQESITAFQVVGTALAKTPNFMSTSNFTEASVRQHAAYAKQLKTRLELGLQTIPSILLIILLTLVITGGVRSGRIRSLPVKVSTIAVLAIAIANLCGWILGFHPLIVLAPGNVALNPLASLCFMAVAIAILLLSLKRHRYVAAGLGLSVCVIALVTALGTANLVPFHLDRGLFRSDMTALSTTTPGQMSLFGCLALLILGLGIVRTVFGSPFKRTAVFTASMAVALGASGLIAKIILLDTYFVVPLIASLSIGGSLLCLLCGIGLLRVIRTDEQARRHLSFFGAILRPALLTVPLIGIGVLAQLQQNAATQHAQDTFNQQAVSLQAAVEKQVAIYTNTLVGAKALFAASRDVERSEWKKYISALNVWQNYPGIRFIGYAPVLDRAGALSATKSAHADGINTFTIFPAGDRAAYTPVVYAEPETANSTRLLGYDIAAETGPSAALQQAAASGNPAVSGKINVVVEATSGTRPDFWMFVPIYSNTNPRDLQGYVFAVLDARSFFTHVFESPAGLRANVYDGFATSSELKLYGDGAPTSWAVLTTEKTLYANGHPWTIQYISSSPFLDAESREPGLILLGGGLAYLGALMFVLWYRLVRRYNKADYAAAKQKGPRV